jgi:hypothetical protein
VHHVYEGGGCVRGHSKVSAGEIVGKHGHMRVDRSRGDGRIGGQHIT